MKSEIDRLAAEESKQVWDVNTNARAEKGRAPAVGREVFQLRDTWEQEHKLDEVVDVNDIADVVAQWTGIR